MYLLYQTPLSRHGGMPHIFQVWSDIIGQLFKGPDDLVGHNFLDLCVMIQNSCLFQQPSWNQNTSVL